MSKKLELLAPAKNLEYGKAAINYGADAVYIGAEKFSARSSAVNSINDIEQLITYAHKFNSKVYTTINTILYDSELNAVKSLINKLYNVGCDAIIIQDLGILQMDIPPIEIFASTQANCYLLDRIKMLEAAGVSRVILARELSLEQIKQIRKDTKLELEFFIFGALCVSLSGQCFISQALSGRSANRGECSQICRHKFSLQSDNKTVIKDKYLLSPKDLNLTNYIENLADAGITSFKIEGRLKDINYLKTSVAFFRKQIDELIENNNGYQKASSGKVYFDFQPDIHSAFNRNFTEYFINGNNSDILAIDTPKFIGKQIAKVIENKGDCIVIDTKAEINNGDGLSYFNSEKELQGFRVNKAEGNVLFTIPKALKIKAGTLLFRNQNFEYEKVLENSKTLRKISSEIFISEDVNSFIFQLIDEEYLSSEYILNKPIEPANNQDNFKDIFSRQLSKSSDSIFSINNINISVEKLPFLKISEINNIRRTLLTLLENKRISEYKTNKRIKTELELEYTEDASFKLNISNELSRSFYKKLGIDTRETALELTKEYQNKPLMTTKTCILNQLGKCLKNNIEFRGKTLYLTDESAKLKLKFDCTNCLMEVYLAENQ